VTSVDAAESDDSRRTLSIVLGTVAGLIVIVLVVVVACYVAHRRPWHAVSRRNHVLRAEMAAFDGPYGAADVRPAALRVQQAGNGQEPGRPTAPELTSISLDELDAEAARQQPTSVKQSFRGIYPNGSWESNRARQLYKNISMLFLFPVKDGKLSTGVIAMFNASCYG